MRRLIYQLAIDLCRVYFNTSRSANHCQQGSISSGTNKYQLSAQTFYDSPPLQNYGQIQLHGSYQLLLLQLISKNPLQFVVVHSLVFLLDGYINQTCAIVPYPKGNSIKSRQSCYSFLDNAQDWLREFMHSSSSQSLLVNALCLIYVKRMAAVRTENRLRKTKPSMYFCWALLFCTLVILAWRRAKTLGSKNWKNNAPCLGDIFLLKIN